MYLNVGDGESNLLLKTVNFVITSVVADDFALSEEVTALQRQLELVSVSNCRWGVIASGLTLDARSVDTARFIRTLGSSNQLTSFLELFIKVRIEAKIRNVPEQNRERAFINAAKTEVMNQTVRRNGNGVRP